jgi:hypothetical protein
MRRDLERRLRRLENSGAGLDAIEVWIEQGDGTLRGRGGERTTHEALAHLDPRGRHTVIIRHGDENL